MMEDIDRNIDSGIDLYSCRMKELSNRVGSILIGTRYLKNIEIDPKFFSCCNGKEVLFKSSFGVSSCGISSRFLRLVSLFKKFSLYWDQSIDVLYKKSFMINSLCFSKEKKDFYEDKKQAIYIDKKYRDSFLKNILSFENKETISSLDFSCSYLSLYLGIFFLWRLDAFVHFVKIGSYFKEYLDFSKMSWSHDKDKINMFIVSIDEKHKLEDVLVLERLINFCYNYNIYLIIVESFLDTKQSDGMDKERKNVGSKKSSFFSKKIASIKEKKLISLVDKNTQSKLYQMLEGS